MTIFPDMKDDFTIDHGVCMTNDRSWENPTAEQQALLALCEEKGWQEAVTAAFPEPGFRAYIMDPERLALLEVLPLAAHQHILEIGPGYGQMTAAIAARVASVDAIEADTAQARFCRIRMDQQGIGNVRITAGGTQARLPYADQSFDGVVMNLVFEWCAIRAERSHEEVQRAYLAEIARVLKPGGFLYLSTKNRFALRLLAGGRDEHMAGKRFGSALPRALGKAVMAGERPEGHLYSHGGLRRRIEQAGFRIETPYWAVPEMRWPTRFVPLDDAGAVGAAQRDRALDLGGRRLSGVMRRLPAGWVKQVTPGLVFVARRTPAPQ